MLIMLVLFVFLSMAAHINVMRPKIQKKMILETNRATITMNPFFIYKTIISFRMVN